MAIILIKISICWGFFALLYVLLLRQETFFRANRAYLLSSLFAGLALPFLPNEVLSVPLGEVTVISNEAQSLAIVLEEVQVNANTWQLVNVLEAVYWIGALMAAARLIWGLTVLFRKILGTPSQHLSDGCQLIESSEIYTPYSFFHWIFVPQGVSASSNTQVLMLAHERAHAKGWHSLDVLCCELLCVFFWFHPLVYWYKRALRSVHEFLADANASRLSDKKQYGLLLIRQSQPGMQIAYANHFFQSPLKQRLVMLTKKSSSPIKALKFGLAVPLALVFALLFRQSPALAQSNGEKTASKSANAAPEFPGGMYDLGKFLSDNIVYPPTAKEANAEGVVVVSFVVQKEGTLKDIKVIETGDEIHPDLVTEAVRVVGKMPKWKPAVKNGKIVKTEFKLPIRFKLDQQAVSEMFDVQQAPEFPGGQEAMLKFLANNIIYPNEARKAGVSGLVVLQYVVEKDGSLSTFNVLKSPRPDMAEEAIRVLKSMPKLNPGMKDGQAVRVRYTLPVRFGL